MAVSVKNYEEERMKLVEKFTIVSKMRQAAAYFAAKDTVINANSTNPILDCCFGVSEEVDDSEANDDEYSVELVTEQV